MKKKNQIKTLVGTLSLLMVAVVISCTRNLSVPVTAIFLTPTPTITGTPTNLPTATFTNTLVNTGTPTYTPTVTGTNTATNTFTNTPTMTFTCLGCNSSTFTSTPTNTFTSTITNTFTNTDTPTITLTVTNTCTNTITPTPTNTTAVTPTFTTTPSVYTDYDDYDSSFYWNGTTVFGWSNCEATAGGTATGIASSVDTVNYYTYADGTNFLCGTGNNAAMPVPQSLAVTIGSFGAGSGATQGAANLYLESAWAQCNNAYSPGGSIVLTTAGTTNSFTVQVLGTGGPVTIKQIVIEDSGAADALTANINQGLTSGTWTNIIVPQSASLMTSGTIGMLQSNGVAAIYFQITGPVSGTARVNFDDLIFY